MSNTVYTIRVGKYNLKLIRETMHLISTLKGRLRKLVESFKLKKRPVKIIADSRNHFAKRSNRAKKKKKIKARKGARTVFTIPGGI